MRTALYAGSFDPPTNGHLWVIKRGTRQFDKLVVAVGTNPDKNYTFSEAERIDMLQKICRWFPGSIEVVSFKNSLLVHFAQEIHAQWLLRGVRNEADFRYEVDMRDENNKIDRDIETVFIVPPPELRRISSSFVKGLTKSKRWEEIVKDHLPQMVYEEFLRRFKQ